MRHLSNSAMESSGLPPQLFSHVPHGLYLRFLTLRFTRKQKQMSMLSFTLLEKINSAIGRSKEMIYTISSLQFDRV